MLTRRKKCQTREAGAPDSEIGQCPGTRSARQVEEVVAAISHIAKIVK